jgi:tetratricopeptide repeat protein/glycosyl transferase family 9 (putative heptosyltransferase)
MNPNDAMAKAAALFGAGRLDEAQALAESILRADPLHFYALHLAGAIALKRGELEACIAFTTRALEIDPPHVEALCNRGAALRRLNHIEAALADYDKALAIDPRSALALNNRGVALAALNRHDEAIASYTKAIELQPGYANAIFHRGLSRLVTGHFASGWDDLEARWSGAETRDAPRTFAQPQWTGREDLRGKTLLAHAEQGLGDTIQFCRYASLLYHRGARIVLEAQAPLVELLATLRGVDRVVARGAALPSFDFHCPLMSLPRAFGTGIDSIPASSAYLKAPDEHVERWRARLGERSGPRIGLAWSGSPTLVNDRNRTIALAQLAPLRELGATPVSLQKEIRDADRRALQEGAPMLHFGAELTDFRDTAALISLMDVVISVDTAVAHLAGAMGKPAWILLPFSPDWRWLLGREDSPWYPSARLFRQPRIGDWDTVIERLPKELAAQHARGQ